MMKKSILILLLLFGIGAVFYLKVSDKNRVVGSQLVPESSVNNADQKRVPAIDLSFEDMGGNAHKLSDFKGKVIILNIRARGCSACQYESKFLKSFYSKIESNANIKLVSIFEGESRGVIARYMKTTDINYPVYVDQLGLSAYKYRVNAVPTSFIIDKQFRVVTMVRGALDWSSDEVVKFLNQLGNE